MKINPGAQLNEKILYQHYTSLYNLLKQFRKSNFINLHLEHLGEDFSLFFTNKIIYCQAKSKNKIYLYELKDILSRFLVKIREDSNVYCTLFSENYFNTKEADRVKSIIQRLNRSTINHPKMLNEINRVINLDFTKFEIDRIQIINISKKNLRAIILNDLHEVIDIPITHKYLEHEMYSIIGKFLELASKSEKYTKVMFSKTLYDIKNKLKYSDEILDSINTKEIAQLLVKIADILGRKNQPTQNKSIMEISDE
ncbi:hypothetical protein KAU33_05410 [Candidatus Dependentiae bacterium]|nr:hypothetical protein [Candidatus Dependentiae bacterium]